ncbi:hypothetical protein [Jannaschia sp. M317]|uniref:hypothetical protein n=1 Tax=Jannaschia sp. M317 TaxID=2867011 RepID=UPI0021A50C6E|nr:hypothetical protein [Jannaschia sp. M317]UWQ17474.1 hypothetical protein K3551_16590 [Jannaschia sp. M317]
MTALRLPSAPTRDIIDTAIALHGPGRVLLAALRAMVRPKSRPPDAALPDHLRRDLGLPPMPPPLPSSRALY